MTIQAYGDIAHPNESSVRSYSRSWPDVFIRATGAKIWSRDREYIDLFAAAGSLNYGHNDPDAKRALTDYLQRDGVLQTLDMQTDAREKFLTCLYETILEPRGLADYKVIFTGPTGTNAVEAAFKCARLGTGRSEIVAFRGGFHGVSLGSLAASSNLSKRTGAGVPLTDVSRFPFDDSSLDAREGPSWFERVHFADRSEAEMPAGVVIELVQGEGGINVARQTWATEIARICEKYDVPLILDDIQMGCGRTGAFFSSEEFDIRPDIITLSKSLSGLGLPLSVVLVKEDLDFKVPGQHNGTFRGSNAAFITATECLQKFWSDERFEIETRRKALLARRHLDSIGVSSAFDVRGRGLVLGIDLKTSDRASRVVRECFHAGVLIETSGSRDQVVKIMPPLTIDDSELVYGISVVGAACLHGRC